MVPKKWGPNTMIIHFFICKEKNVLLRLEVCVCMCVCRGGDHIKQRQSLIQKVNYDIKIRNCKRADEFLFLWFSWNGFFVFFFQVPKSMESSVEALCRYVIKPAVNDMEKCRLFYRWITNNISQVVLNELLKFLFYI